MNRSLAESSKHLVEVDLYDLKLPCENFGTSPIRTLLPCPPDITLDVIGALRKFSRVGRVGGGEKMVFLSHKKCISRNLGAEFCSLIAKAIKLLIFSAYGGLLSS